VERFDQGGENLLVDSYQFVLKPAREWRGCGYCGAAFDGDVNEGLPSFHYTNYECAEKGGVVINRNTNVASDALLLRPG
jgi:hypothetical protein